jgi:hypothetical protein
MHATFKYRKDPLSNDYTSIAFSGQLSDSQIPLPGDSISFDGSAHFRVSKRNFYSSLSGPPPRIELGVTILLD